MNTKQLNQIESHVAGHDLLTTAPEAAGIKSLPGKVTAYGKKIDAILKLVDLQTRSSATIAQREVSFDDMYDVTLTNTGIALSYADEKEIPGLADQMRKVPSNFAKARLAMRVRLAQQLYDAVLAIVPDLVDYGLTAGTMTDWQKKIDAAAKAVPAVRAATADKKAVTADLKVAVQKAGQMERNQIHPLLLPLKKSNPEFYGRYAARRQVLDRPGVRSKPDTGTPVPPDGGTPVPTAT